MVGKGGVPAYIGHVDQVCEKLKVCSRRFWGEVDGLRFDWSGAIDFYFPIARRSSRLRYLRCAGSLFPESVAGSDLRWTSHSVVRDVTAPCSRPLNYQ